MSDSALPQSQSHSVLDSDSEEDFRLLNATTGLSLPAPSQQVRPDQVFFKNQDASDEQQIELHQDDINYVEADLVSPSPPPEDIKPFYIYALYDFVATDPSHATTAKDDELILLDDSDSYWWLIQNVRDNSIGFIPADATELPQERLARLNRWKNEQSERIRKHSLDNLSDYEICTTPKLNNIKSVAFTSPTYFSASENDDGDDDGDLSDCEADYEDEGIDNDNDLESSEDLQQTMIGDSNIDNTTTIRDAEPELDPVSEAELLLQTEKPLLENSPEKVPNIDNYTHSSDNDVEETIDSLESELDHHLDVLTSQLEQFKKFDIPPRPESPPLEGDISPSTESTTDTLTKSPSPSPVERSGTPVSDLQEDSDAVNSSNSTTNSNFSLHCPSLEFQYKDDEDDLLGTPPTDIDSKQFSSAEHVPMDESTPTGSPYIEASSSELLTVSSPRLDDVGTMDSAKVLENSNEGSNAVAKRSSFVDYDGHYQQKLKESIKNTTPIVSSGLAERSPLLNQNSPRKTVPQPLELRPRYRNTSPKEMLSDSSDNLLKSLFRPRGKIQPITRELLGPKRPTSPLYPKHSFKPDDNSSFQPSSPTHPHISFRSDHSILTSPRIPNSTPRTSSARITPRPDTPVELQDAPIEIQVHGIPTIVGPIAKKKRSRSFTDIGEQLTFTQTTRRQPERAHSLPDSCITRQSISYSELFPQNIKENDSKALSHNYSFVGLKHSSSSITSSPRLLQNESAESSTTQHDLFQQHPLKAVLLHPSIENIYHELFSSFDSLDEQINSLLDLGQKTVST